MNILIFFLVKRILITSSVYFSTHFPKRKKNTQLQILQSENSCWGKFKLFKLFSQPILNQNTNWFAWPKDQIFAAIEKIFRQIFGIGRKILGVFVYICNHDWILSKCWHFFSYRKWSPSGRKLKKITRNRKSIDEFFIKQSILGLRNSGQPQLALG